MRADVAGEHTSAVTQTCHFVQHLTLSPCLALDTAMLTYVLQGGALYLQSSTTTITASVLDSDQAVRLCHV